MTRETFRRAVHAGIARIPEPFRGAFAEIAVVTEDEPSEEQLRVAGLSAGDDLLGLYEGTPRTERQYLPYRFPEKITLFRGAFARLCGDDEDCLREEVASTIWHELGHALGLSEKRIRALERRRRRADRR